MENNEKKESNNLHNGGKKETPIMNPFPIQPLQLFKKFNLNQLNNEELKRDNKIGSQEWLSFELKSKYVSKQLN